MSTPSTPDHSGPSAPADRTFESHRPRLLALAYRLLGSRGDAEDVVQDTWLRWNGTDREAVREPEAWLVATATRLGIDRLRRSRHEREHYTGPWLPEPLSIEPMEQPEHQADIASQVSIAFLAMLETLGPEERAAFLLKEAFDYEYAQIAALLGSSEANCRQMVHRARGRVQSGKPRFEVKPAQHRRLLERFMEAIGKGDRDSIAALLDANASLVSDGGGKVIATRRPLHGAERIARLYWAVARRVGATASFSIGRVNGEPALLRWHDGRLHSISIIVIEGDRITRILSVLNPEKLRAYTQA